MTTKCAEVIKRECVKVDGSVCLRPSTGVHVQPQMSQRVSDPIAGMTPQAQIVESNSEFAIIEVICACGCKNQIECRF